MHKSYTSRAQVVHKRGVIWGRSLTFARKSSSDLSKSLRRFRLRLVSVHKQNSVHFRLASLAFRLSGVRVGVRGSVFGVRVGVRGGVGITHSHTLERFAFVLC